MLVGSKFFFCLSCYFLIFFCNEHKEKCFTLIYHVNFWGIAQQC